MIRRTKDDPASPHFADYAGRGIKVCKRWKDFNNFYADMGKRPSIRHSLGRINNDRGYEPGNCEWQTKRRQQRDRRGSRKHDAVRLIHEYTGKKDLTLRQVAHRALASLRSTTSKASTPCSREDIIAGFMLWLHKNKAGVERPKRKNVERKKPVSVDQHSPSDSDRTVSTWEETDAYKKWREDYEKKNGPITAEESGPVTL